MIHIWMSKIIMWIMILEIIHQIIRIICIWISSLQESAQVKSSLTWISITYIVTMTSDMQISTKICKECIFDLFLAFLVWNGHKNIQFLSPYPPRLVPDIYLVSFTGTVAASSYRKEWGKLWGAQYNIKKYRMYF